MKDNVIKKVLFMLIAESLRYAPDRKIDILYVIDTALDFSNLFYQNRVGNLSEYWELKTLQDLPKELENFRDTIKISKVGKSHKTHHQISHEKLTEYVLLGSSAAHNFLRKMKDIDIQEKNLSSTLKLFLNDMNYISKGMQTRLGYSTKKLEKIQDKYKNIVNVVHWRLEEANRIKSFFTQFKNSNMNYIAEVDRVVFYPFLYDLLIHMFVIDTRIEEWVEEYQNNKKIFDKLSKVRLNADKEQLDIRFMDVEFLKISEFLTFIEPRDWDSLRLYETKDELKYKIQEYIYIYILYSYSRVLNCEYSHLKSTFKQLQNISTKHADFKVSLTKKREKLFKEVIENEEIRFSEQDFRFYSLMVL